MHSFSEGSPEARRLLPIAHELLAAAEPRAARRSAARGGLPRGRLPAPLGPALEVLPRQVPLRDAPRPARPARRRARGCGRASTSRRPCGSPGPSSERSRSPRRRRSRAGLPFLIVRKEAKDYGTANRLEGVYAEGANASASSRTSSPPAVRRSRPSQALREAGLRVPTRSASSTARRAASTSSRAMRCVCGRSSRPQNSSEMRRKSAWLSRFVRTRC